MTVKTTKILNGAITLPKELRRGWKGADVILRSSDDTIVVKKMQKVPFWETWQKLRAVNVNKKVSKKDVETAIKWARR